MNALNSLSSQIAPLKPAATLGSQQLEQAEELRETYRQFVGKTFFGQLLKSMRSSVGEPAYFHGGRAEEVFRGQLDQHLADHMTDASASKLADPMFAQQFPEQARVLNRAELPTPLEHLSQLRRF